jgi:hypothetical protein
MNAAEIVSALTAHDANVVLEDERVRVLHPAGSPPPTELIEAARQQRDALRVMLARERTATMDTPYSKALAALRSKCPEFVEPERWLQALGDAEILLSLWGSQAGALGWTARELFGLHPIPERPASNFRRLARYDSTGLIWLLQGRPVIALTDSEAAIQSAGAVVVYRKHNKPALGPLGDSLDDMGPMS